MYIVYLKRLLPYFIIFGVFSSADINECEDNNGGCSQECNNDFASYYCSCIEGYYLLADNHTCNG